MDDLDLIRRRAGLDKEDLSEAMFTRRHFTEVARILRERVQDEALRRELSGYFLMLFKDSNPNFDVNRWNAAVFPAGG